MNVVFVHNIGHDYIMYEQYQCINYVIKAVYCGNTSALNVTCHRVCVT